MDKAFAPVADMSREELAEELLAWRRDAVARLHVAAFCVNNATSEEDRANEYVRHLSPQLAMVESVLSRDFHECCEDSGEPIKPGDRFHPYEDGVKVKLVGEPDPRDPPPVLMDDLADDLPRAMKLAKEAQALAQGEGA